MDWTSELEVSSKKLVPRLGRRAGQGSASRDDFKSEDDPLDSPASLSSLATATPVAPPRARKTGWGDETKGSKTKMSSSIIEQERFRGAEKGDRSGLDDGDDADVEVNERTGRHEIPVIPDLEDVQDDNIQAEIANAPATNVTRVAAYREVDTDLLKNTSFASLDDLDLSLLAEKLYSDKLVKEIDQVWNWELLFTQIASEINSELQNK